MSESTQSDESGGGMPLGFGRTPRAIYPGALTYQMVADGAEALRGHVPVIGCSCRWDEDGNPPADCGCAEQVTVQLRDYAYRVLHAALRPEAGS